MQPFVPTESPYRQQVRLAIRRQRESIGLSQSAAARLCGVGQSVYAHAENGDGTPCSLEKLIGLAERLGLRVRLVCTVDGGTAVEPQTVEPGRNRGTTVEPPPWNHSGTMEPDNGTTMEPSG